MPFIESKHHRMLCAEVLQHSAKQICTHNFIHDAVTSSLQHPRSLCGQMQKIKRAFAPLSWNGPYSLLQLQPLMIQGHVPCDDKVMRNWPSSDSDCSVYWGSALLLLGVRACSRCMCHCWRMWRWRRGEGRQSQPWSVIQTVWDGKWLLAGVQPLVIDEEGAE